MVGTESTYETLLGIKFRNNTSNNIYKLKAKLVSDDFDDYYEH